MKQVNKKLWLWCLGLMPLLQVLAQPTISRMEYYIDTDPGYGNGIFISNNGTNNLSTFFAIDLTPINSGVHVVGVRSKDANGAWSIDNKYIFRKPVVNAAVVPTINKVEYFVDTDPGYGKAVDIPITVGQDLSNLGFTLNLNTLNQGVHMVGTRSQDANGAWSLDNKYIFLKPFTNGLAIPNINKVEYFVDVDPGYGKAVAVPITAGQDLSNLNFTLDMTVINQGTHIVGVRSQDANGAWSLDNKYIFLKPFTNGLAIPNIKKVEYFVDTDPGYGKAIAVPITPGQDLSNLNFTLDMTVVNQGTHIVGVRSQDANGAWSIDNKWLFLKPFSAANLASRNVSSIEYYFDTDPGYGKGIPVAITASTQIDNMIVNADISGLSVGNHNIYFRSQDDQKSWSLNYVQSFTLNGALPVTMLYFTALKNGNIAKLTWATSSETNSKNFLVQRSFDGINFNLIGTVKASGNSNITVNYEYDDNISSLTNYPHIYYRLQQMDINGDSKYSAIAAINMGESMSQLTLLRNPVQFEANLNYTSTTIETIAIKVIDLNGKILITKELTVTKGSNAIQLNTNSLAKGIYLIEAVSKKNSQFVRMMKQ